MPLVVRGTAYPQPGEDGQRGPTGSEIDIIESHFEVDFGDLMSQLARTSAGVVHKPGCTTTRALYAWCWIVMHRAERELTVQNVMDEYGIDELSLTDPEEPAGSKKARPTSAARAAT